MFDQLFGGTIKETYYTKNLKYAKDFFARELAAYYEIKGIIGINELYKKLTLQLMFNIHEIEDDYDVFVAFETMNNRGKRLTNLELLKNRLIYLTTLYNRDVLDETDEIALRELINKTWCEVYYQLGRNENELLSDDEFLRAHWIMYFSYSRKKGDDYIKFLLKKFSHKSIFENKLISTTLEKEEDEKITDPGADDEEIENSQNIPEPISGEFLWPKEIMDYVNSLKETAEYWYYTYFPDKCTTISEEEQVWIDKLNRIGISYFRPMVAVSLIPRLGISKESRIAFYKATERFIFINFRMAMYQSNYKSSDYYRKTKEVYSGRNLLEDVTSDILSTTNENAQDAIKVFLSRMNRRFISGEGFYNWRDLRYFLYEYEYSLSTKYKIEKLSWAVLTKVVKDKITIEHILPQSPTRFYWRNTFRQFTENEIRLLSGSLGNLLPLSQSINSSLQNISFEEKKERGYANGSHSEVEISKEEIWDAQHIYDRGINLLRFMEERWNFNFDNIEQMDELLHIGFIKDGRDIPPELKENQPSVSQKTPANGDRNLSRSEYIGLLTRAWATAKNETGEINVNFAKCGIKNVRFTTNLMNRILPNASEAASGWGTKNHHFYEIVNNSGKELRIQLALSSKNIPHNLRTICETINEYFPSRIQKQDWEWRWPFISSRFKITEDTSDEEVFADLNSMYSQLIEFEKRLDEVMGK